MFNKNGHWPHSLQLFHHRYLRSQPTKTRPLHHPCFTLTRTFFNDLNSIRRCICTPLYMSTPIIEKIKVSTKAKTASATSASRLRGKVDSSQLSKVSEPDTASSHLPEDLYYFESSSYIDSSPVLLKKNNNNDVSRSTCQQRQRMKNSQKLFKGESIEIEADFLVKSDGKNEKKITGLVEKNIPASVPDSDLRMPISYSFPSTRRSSSRGGKQT